MSSKVSGLLITHSISRCALTVISNMVRTVLSGRQARNRRLPLLLLLLLDAKLLLAVKFAVHKAVTDVFCEAGNTVVTACHKEGQKGNQ